MDKEFLLNLGLTEDQIGKILEKGQEEARVPKSRLDEVINERNQLKEQLAERDMQLDNLKKSNKDNEELSKQIEQLKAENKLKKEEFESKLKAERIDNLVELSLFKNGVINPKLAKNGLDLSNITLDESGNLKGLEEQLKKLKETDPYLFKVEEKQEVKGVEPVGAKSSSSNINVSLTDALKNYYSK